MRKPPSAPFSRSSLVRGDEAANEALREYLDDRHGGDRDAVAGTLWALGEISFEERADVWAQEQVAKDPQWQWTTPKSAPRG